MRISSAIEGDVLIIKLNGEVDHSVSKNTREVADMLIDKSNKKTVVIDLKKVDFMDSAGIGLILGRYKKLKAAGGTLSVRNVVPSVDKLLVISGIYNLVRKI